MKHLKLESIPTRSEISIYENRVNTYKDYANTADKVLRVYPGIALICSFIIMIALFLNKNCKGAIIAMMVMLIFLLYQVFLSSGMAHYVTEQMSGVTRNEEEKRLLQVENYRIFKEMEQFEADNEISGSSISFNRDSKTLFIKLKTADERSGEWESNVRVDKWFINHRSDGFTYNFEDNSLIIPGECKKGN